MLSKSLHNICHLPSEPGGEAVNKAMIMVTLWICAVAHMSKPHLSKEFVCLAGDEGETAWMGNIACETT